MLVKVAYHWDDLPVAEDSLEVDDGGLRLVLQREQEHHLHRVLLPVLQHAALI